jgi:hypothetical protein
MVVMQVYIPELGCPADRAPPGGLALPLQVVQQTEETVRGGEQAVMTARLVERAGEAAGQTEARLH